MSDSERVVSDLGEKPDGMPSHPATSTSLGAGAVWLTSIWPYYPATGTGLAFIGLLVALDDVIDHMTGFPTPLDQV